MDRLKPRGYQLYIISRILKAKYEGANVVIELDAGMGKRVVSFLMTNYLEPGERLLFITPSRASLKDTYKFFEQNISNKKINVSYLSTGTPKHVRENSLKKSTVLISTPITLYNSLSKTREIRFDYIFINEIDKVVRRVAYVPVYDRLESYLSKFTLVYPWMHLRELLNQDACWVGLSGTLRDHHTLRIEDTVLLKRELETITELLFPKQKKLYIITMEELLKNTDAYQYLMENITIVKSIPIYDDLVKKMVKPITSELFETTKKLISKYLKSDEAVFDPESYEKMEKAISKLPDSDSLKRKFLRLALIRRFILASTPNHYKRFLARPSITRLIKKTFKEFDVASIPNRSKKIERIKEIVEKWLSDGKKIAIMCSYIKTAIEIKEKLNDAGIEALLLTGKTRNKGQVIEEYKKNQRKVLILTPVGERDLDLPGTDLLIVHDVINTVKSMYQRFKRGRRSFVAVLFYKDTYEEEKVSKLLQRIKRRYPWSIIVD